MQWNLFRGRLRKALRDTDPEMEEIEQDKPTPHDVETLTRGVIDAKVLTAYLNSERDDLPPEYVPRLLGIKELELSAADYLSPNSSPMTSSRNQSPSQIAARRTAKETWNAQSTRYAPKDVHYVSLACEDANALRRAFSDRIHRAGISKADLGRKFNLTMGGRSKSRCHEISNFLDPNQTGQRGEAFVFSHKLQERFSEMSAFLNESIHRNEGPDAASLPSTEQFVIDLLREGTACEPERAAEGLRKLSEHVLKHIGSVPSGAR